MFVFPPGSTYEKEWKRVDSLEQKAQFKSALDLTNSIYQKAKTENNAAQIVKALMHRFKFSGQVEEASQEKTITDLQLELKTAGYPLKPVLHSMLAEMYWQYYEVNRWTIQQRSQTVNFKLDDIATWDINTIVDQCIKNYRLSLEPVDSLKRTKIEIYDPVLYNGYKTTREFRPTLYDFVAHRAVDFFMNEEPDITRPADRFELTDTRYMSNYADFIKLNIESKDSMSLKYFAIKNLQALIAFHATDSRSEARIDADLKRLKFCKNKLASESKDSLYIKALENIAASIGEIPMAAEVQYEIAMYYHDQAGKYKPLENDAHKWENKKAIEICEAAIKKYPGTDGAFNCEQLKKSIQVKNFSFQIEQTMLPGKPGIVLMNFYNVKKAYLRLVQMPEETVRYRYGGDGFDNEKKRMEYYLKLKTVATWSLDLPDDGDYQQHKAEIKVPEQPVGRYMLLVSADEKFSLEKNAIAHAEYYCSNISYVHRRTNDGSDEYLALHRATGQPLAGLKTQLWFEKYDQSARQYKMVKGDALVTDKDGYVRIPPPGEWRNFMLEFRQDNDVLFTDYAYQYRYHQDDQKRTRTNFFTDRMIYRPGQTIYFKGIMIETDGETHAILKNRSTTVTFYDANYQKISSLDLTTNEYGTFSGSFVAPQGVLTGQMRIDNGYGNIYLSVEEYKRPKFEVKINPVKGMYRLGEEISVEGFAKAYAGSNIDGAKVNFRVVRNASFPYWWWCWRGYYPSSPEVEVTNGTVTSNDTGGFVIKFKAVPDPSVSSESKPTYSYSIYADVTDVSGETHSASGYVSVGYAALSLNIGVSEKMEKNDTIPWTINCNNLAGEPEKAQGTIGIWKVNEPSVAYRSRHWERPDKFIFKKEEWTQWFPNDEYNEEANMFKWARAEKVYDGKFDTGKEKKRKFDLSSWKQGLYVLEAITKDKYGQEVKDVRYFTVYGAKETALAKNDFAWFTPIDVTGQPGEKASFLVGSAADVTVLYEIEHKNRIVAREWLRLNKEQKLIEIPIEEKHRGNFSFHLVHHYDNRSYRNDATVNVAWSNKELELEFESFRSKLTPGQQEEWKIKVKGPKGEKLAAEMVAALYDASLDAFRPNYWYFNIWNYSYSSLNWQQPSDFSTSGARMYQEHWNEYYGGRRTRYYDQLNWFGFSISNYYYGYYGYDDYDGDNRSYRGNRNRVLAKSAEAPAGGAPREESEKDSSKGGKKEDSSVSRSANGQGTTTATGKSGGDPQFTQFEGKNVDLLASGEEQSGKMNEIKARSNLAETAFFYPQLQTNEKGEIIIKFTIPEALTRWKMMGFAHTQNLEYGQIQNELVTQKDLMVMPHAPRFFRENDRITFTAKVSNLSEGDLNGKAQIYFYDATTMQDITRRMIEQVHGAGPDIEAMNDGVVTFSAKKGQSAALSWNVGIPEGIGAIQYKVVASAGKFTDGEEAALPVLSNRMLVTETMPLPIRGGQTKDFRFDKLISQGGGSPTLRNHKLTLEFTSNPAWYAVQSLPYLMEYPYECAEQTFSRYYANSIASHIANSSPKIKAVFDSWRTQDPKALLSNLEKNQELKALMLEETPWVLDAKDESERKRRVALLFDLNRMSSELDRAERKLLKMQYSNGGWPWFEGGPDDRYITQHVVTGMGHLDKLGVKSVRGESKIWNMVSNAVRYLDDRICEDYEWILKHDKAHLNDDHLGYTQIQYLYARSYFKDIAVDNRNKKAFDYYTGQAKKYWTSKSRYMQGMIALGLSRNADKVTPPLIMKSLKDNAIVSDEMGMYWKENYAGYYWYQAPIETQALLIEAFDEVAKDTKAVDDLKVWLLKSKQTQDWKTTKATTEACYALLMRGTDWLATESGVEIMVGSIVVDPKKMDGVKQEAGTGYFKTSWSGKEITPDMGTVKVTKKDAGVSWGALYWQYFEQLDRITPHETPLKLSKKLFLQQNTSSGPVITPISDGTTLKVGDKVKVRIELRVDRDMEYVHLKDMRASAFEPVNVFSQYKWQDGLGYYESTRDASTNFFFDRLPKGTYVFEYPVFVSHAGNFSNGISTIQCMYAPEFAGHSEGVRVKVSK
ncbi:MAG: hypothetical protein FD123_29 [Bacteroidetes bacterium]|nr:MAG: hypothetical protein FD123_29 [Bacteroidota bacterium]